LTNNKIKTKMFLKKKKGEKRNSKGFEKSLDVEFVRRTINGEANEIM